ncbi:MAG: hypothetical protein J1G02_02650 [Clostridiales bacterium]|nr:hypothetical protein [Clostridiales bacterium]
MNTQELFDNAQDRYVYARELVTRMVDFATQSNIEVNLKDAYDQLDIVVQYILLKIAVADGKFLEIEGEFMDNITDSYDLLYLFDSYYDTDYDWSFVGAYLNFEHVIFLLDKIDQLAIGHIRAFSDLFAEIDMLDSSVNYGKELYECIRDIALAFIMCDGNAADRELKIAVDVVSEYLTTPWLINKHKRKNQS